MEATVTFDDFPMATDPETMAALKKAFDECGTIRIITKEKIYVANFNDVEVIKDPAIISKIVMMPAKK